MWRAGRILELYYGNGTTAPVLLYTWGHQRAFRSRISVLQRESFPTFQHLPQRSQCSSPCFQLYLAHLSFGKWSTMLPDFTVVRKRKRAKTRSRDPTKANRAQRSNSSLGLFKQYRHIPIEQAHSWRREGKQTSEQHSSNSNRSAFLEEVLQTTWQTYWCHGTVIPQSYSILFRLMWGNQVKG